MFDEQELKVLKAIITDKKSALDFINNNDAKLFSADLWNFANLITNYIKTNKEIPTLRIITEKLDKSNNETLLKKINTIWQELEKVKIDSKEYKYDLDKIKKRFAEKQLLETKSSLAKLEAGNIDVSKTISDLQKTIQSIKSLDNNALFFNKDVKDYLPTFVEKFNAKKNNKNFERGLLTKYSFIDYATNGLKPADFMLICGESGFGKSLFLLNINLQMWLQDNIIFKSDGSVASLNNFSEGKNIIYFSLEMPYEDCFNRFLSRLSGVASRNIENAQLSKTDFEKIKACLDFIKKYPYQFKIVDIIDACTNDLEAILLDTGDKYDAISVDYLGIMHPNKGSEEQDWLKQSTISQELRGLCRKLQVPMFSAVQLNRKSAGKDAAENIGLARLARSAGIATHATHIIQIENRPNEENHFDFIYHIIKNRKGPRGKGILIKSLGAATLLDKVEDADNSYDNYFKDRDDISEELENLEL